MTEHETTKDANLTAAIREVMAKPEVRLTFTFGLSMTGSKQGVLIEHRTGFKGRWARFSHVIWAQPGQSVGDLMHLLADVRAEERQT